MNNIIKALAVSSIPLFLIALSARDEIVKLREELSKSRYYQEKYQPLDDSLKEISQREYTEQYKCGDFSKDAVALLNEKSIQSSIIIGESPKTSQEANVVHAWVAVWFEPQSGNFTKDYFEVDRELQTRSLEQIK